MNQLENNILDLILVSEENIVSDVIIDSPLSTSDHNMIYMFTSVYLGLINLILTHFYLSSFLFI